MIGIFTRQRVDDQPASFFVDLALASIAPITNAPVMAYFNVEVRAPRPDGMSSQDEFDNLMALENSIEAGLKAEAAHAR